MARPLGNRVRFLGARDDVAEVLRAFDLFVLCSRWEGEPIVLLEAMATALPCVAAANAAAQELLGSNRAGRLVPLGDPGELAQAIDELAADPELRALMGDAGRRAIEGRGGDALARAVLRVYQSHR